MIIIRIQQMKSRPTKRQRSKPPNRSSVVSNPDDDSPNSEPTEETSSRPGRQLSRHKFGTLNYEPASSGSATAGSPSQPAAAHNRRSTTGHRRITRSESRKRLNSGDSEIVDAELQPDLAANCPELRSRRSTRAQFTKYVTDNIISTTFTKCV